MVRGEEIAQATAKLSSLDIWEKSWKGVCISTIRYILLFVFHLCFSNILLGMFLSIVCIRYVCNIQLPMLCKFMIG